MHWFGLPAGPLMIRVGELLLQWLGWATATSAHAPHTHRWRWTAPRHTLDPSDWCTDLPASPSVASPRSRVAVA